MTCLECFTYSFLDGVPLQIAVDDEHPNFACENECCSPHSPGPVDDDERVGFFLIDPTSYDNVTKVVTPDAFRELTNRDLSLIRIGKASKIEAESTREKLIERGRLKNPPQVRLVDEMCIAKVEDIRAARYLERRVLAIYDTALPAQPAHASVFASKLIHEGGKAARKRARALCFEIFGKTIVPFQDFLSDLRD